MVRFYDVRRRHISATSKKAPQTKRLRLLVNNSAFHGMACSLPAEMNATVKRNLLPKDVAVTTDTANRDDRDVG